MTFGARVYLVSLLVVAALVGGLELLPRSHRGVSGRDLTRVRRLADDEMARIERRIEEGIATPDEDAAAHVAASHRRDDAQREKNIRNIQTAAIVALLPISLVMLASGLRPAMRRRSMFVARGIVERTSDEVVLLDAADAGAAIAKLMPSKALAIRECMAGRAVRCGNCGKRLRFDAIGRIGKRIVKQRPPAGVQDAKVVGQGWWWRHLDPRACDACGANDPQPF